MQKHIATTNITVGYDFNNDNSIPIKDLLFCDWLYNNCSARIDRITRTLTLSEEEFVWLIIAYPAADIAKYVTIKFDEYASHNTRKRYTNGHLDTE